MTRKILEEALEHIKISKDAERTYRIGEVGEILTKLECMGCIKASHAGTSGVDLAIGGDEAIRDILYGNNLIRFTYVKELPQAFY